MSQLALFKPEPGATPPYDVFAPQNRPARFSDYMEFNTELAQALVLELCQNGEWVEDLDIFDCINMYPSDLSRFAISPLVKAGILEEGQIFYGAECPSEKGYRGFRNKYRRAQ